MVLKLNEIKNKMKEKKLNQKEFENFVCNCESEEDYECILTCALDMGLELEDSKEKVMNVPKDSAYYSEDIIDQYFHEIGDYPILNKETEQDTIEKAQNNDEDARNLLVTSNLKLVAKIALKYSKSGVNYIDLIQEGTIGLIKAIDKYNKDKGHGFSLYATWWIKREIINFISDKVRSIKVPNYIYLQNKKIELFERKYINENNKFPTNEEIEKELGISKDEIEKLKTAAEIGVVGMSESSENYITDNQTIEKIDEELKLLEEKANVSELLKKVSKLEREVIELLFGLTENGKLTIKETANELELSTDKIKLIKDRALVKLRYSGDKIWL